MWSFNHQHKGFLEVWSFVFICAFLLGAQHTECGWIFGEVKCGSCGPRGNAKSRNWRPTSSINGAFAGWMMWGKRNIAIHIQSHLLSSVETLVDWWSVRGLYYITKIEKGNSQSMGESVSTSGSERDRGPGDTMICLELFGGFRSKVCWQSLHI